MASIWESHPELVEELKEMWREGFSAAQISRKLGNGLSRNACIGKAMRLKLTDHGVRTSRHTVITKPVVAAPPKPLSPDGARNLELIVDETLGVVTILNARDCHCRFPYGEPGQENFRYCGRQKERGSYCAGHATLAYVAVVPYKRISDDDKKMVASLERATGLQRMFG